MYKPAKESNDLERFFVERANAGDVEGFVALHESGATLDYGDGEVVVGLDQLRIFFTSFVTNHPQLALGVQATALISGDFALTSSRLENGDITAEVARCQPDGDWFWAVDQFTLGKRTHSISLYAVLEQQFAVDRATALIKRCAKGARFVWLEPPIDRGGITAFDVPQAGTAEQHCALVRRWAKEVWRAWSPHREVVEAWTAQARAT